MSKKFQPMLAARKLPAEIKFPLLASPKIDGIRVVIKDGVALTRKLEPVPNPHIQKLLGHPEFNDLDGEIICGDITDPKAWNNTQSGVMRDYGEPEFTFCVFDIDRESAYRMRYAYIENFVSFIGQPFLQLVKHRRVENMEQLQKLKDEFIAAGYEGLMIRSLDGPYKYGRSTEKEGHLLKMKNWDDSEAQIVGISELLHNENELQEDKIGHAKRATKQEFKRGGSTMGALECIWPIAGGAIEFNIGTGFDAALRQYIWDHPEEYIGKLAKLKHQGVTPDGKPRFPVFLGIRDERDL